MFTNLRPCHRLPVPIFTEVHVYNLTTSRPSDIQTISDSKSRTSQHFDGNKAKGRISNGCFKKTKYAKFSVKRTFLTP